MTSESYRIVYAIGGWDGEAGESVAGGYCCGATDDPAEAAQLVAEAEAEAWLYGWEPGQVVVTDGQGRRVDLPLYSFTP
jgi:hypothetical protein